MDPKVAYRQISAKGESDERHFKANHNDDSDQPNPSEKGFDHSTDAQTAEEATGGEDRPPDEGRRTGDQNDDHKPHEPIASPTESESTAAVVSEGTKANDTPDDDRTAAVVRSRGGGSSRFRQQQRMRFILNRLVDD